MQLSAAMQQAMNDQIRKEFSAAYLYLSMSAHFSQRNFDGFARWMRMQAVEELKHAMKIVDYVEDRGGRVLLQAVEAPPAEWPTPLAVFEHAMQHEALVSSGIHALVTMAGSEKDYATQVMLQWFVTEQVEEEKTSTHLVETLRLIGDNASGLYMLDRELGQRGSTD